MMVSGRALGGAPPAPPGAAAVSREPQSAVPATLGAAVAAGALRLPGAAARLEAEALLAHQLGRSRAWLMAHGETPLPAAALADYQEAVARLAAGEPLAYLTGHREFFGLDFLITPQVLVPRPETELLVERALAAAMNLLARHESRITDYGLRIADIGTGSGCIAVALAVRLPGASFLATDLSAGALAVAWQNAARHGVVDRIDFRLGDLLEPLSSPVDILCANLPYIDSEALAGLPVARHEPRLALDGGPGGLRAIRRMLARAPACLRPGGCALLEIGAGQGQAALALAQAAFPAAAISLQHDLAGLERLLVVQQPAPASTPNS